MILYSETKSQFQADVAQNRISERILESFRTKAGHGVGASEVRSWDNSMQFMRNVLDDGHIPNDSQVSIEYTIPQCSKRIDFILSGKSKEQRDTAVIVELKQWETVERTEKDAVVRTVLGGGTRETGHPSYQAWTYAALLEDFNETVQEDAIQLVPCAYLHNCTSPDVIRDPFYEEHLARAPAFVRSDVDKLRDFIKQHIRYGDPSDIMYRIDHGRIRPSKSLADALASMLQGNAEFLMIDDQKLVYETALSLVREPRDETKEVLIVEGGPGTGKSVVAVNLLVEFTKQGLNARYISKNAAPRAVYESKLVGTFKKSRISNLFAGSGGFTKTEQDTFDVLVVDEAHRLNEKGGLYQNLGENQVKEIISASRSSIFFLDEDQRVHLKDIGTKEEIRRWASELGASVQELELQSQFRCNGSDGYLAWVDHALQIRETANPDFEGIDYEFEVFESPAVLRDRIYQRNAAANKARLVAGYCWKWKSKKDASAIDISFAGTDFAMQWNLDKDGSLWIVSPESVKEVGCIHTCQGLELDYVGVIIGPDLVIRDGVAVVDASHRASQDSSVRGLKKMKKEDPEEAARLEDLIVKNTYRTLMTRGQKGCFVYSEDEETRAYFKSFLSSAREITASGNSPYEGLSLPQLSVEEVQPYENAVPVFDLRIVAGGFGEVQGVEDCAWVALPDPFVPKKGYFVARVVGESMNRRIPNGSWCLFASNPAGSRQGKTVIVQHRSIQDPDFAARLTIKTYHSTKTELDDGSWRHEKIVLRPDSTISGYNEIVLEREDAEELRVLGELVAILA